MAWNWQRSFWAGLFFLGAIGGLACEDNPDECFEDGDCPDGMKCATTQFLTGSPSGGTCVECIADSDCTDPALPTCNAITHACECSDPTGMCGPQEGGVEGGIDATAEDGSVEESDAGEDDAGR